MHTTLSPVTVQRFVALQGELIGLVEQDYTGLSPKLEQIHSRLRVHANRVSGLPRSGLRTKARRGPTRVGSLRLGVRIFSQGGAGLEDYQGANRSPAS